nr:variable surface lipoprotein [Mycoplasmopsis bovis]
MKKSKFLLLGSVASLASIPFVVRLNVVKPKKKRNLRKVTNQLTNSLVMIWKKTMIKASQTKTKTKKTWTDKDKKDQEKSEKDKVENTKIDDSKINKNLGSFPKGLITNAVRQKDIRDKIVGILKTQNFNLDVNYRETLKLKLLYLMAK